MHGPPHTITIHRVLSAAHAIRLPDGSLEPLHWHRWRLKLTIGCDELDEHGWVMDFHELEAGVDALLAPLQRRSLNDCPPFAGHAADGGDSHSLACNPTAENLVMHLGRAVEAMLPGDVQLVEAQVTEAPGCIAGWRPGGGVGGAGR